MAVTISNPWIKNLDFTIHTSKVQLHNTVKYAIERRSDLTTISPFTPHKMTEEKSKK